MFDHYGNLYGGITHGVIGSPPSVSIVEGFITTPNISTIDFLPGFSFNYSEGIGVGNGVTYVPHTGVSDERGIYTPGAGVSVGYAICILPGRKNPCK